MIEPLTIEAIAQACKGKLDAGPAIIAASIAFSGVVIAALINSRMTVIVRNLTRQHDEQITKLSSMLTEARSEKLAVHEAGLRVQAEVRLRLHEKSWGILRDLVEAIQICHDAFLGWMAAMDVGSEEQKDQEYAAATVALTRVRALSAMSPPGTDFESLSVILSTLFTDIGKIGKEHTSAQVMEAMHTVFEAAAVAITSWNRELWGSVVQQPVAKVEAAK
ncbi:MAG TPA: hypothetical protein VJV79_02915 [Polyangiaceae bacterium]|nr:hypothetical protein [Polyangiaceae bacterium]